MLVLNIGIFVCTELSLWSPPAFFWCMFWQYLKHRTQAVIIDLCLFLFNRLWFHLATWWWECHYQYFKWKCRICLCSAVCMGSGPIHCVGIQVGCWGPSHLLWMQCARMPWQGARFLCLKEKPKRYFLDNFYRFHVAKHISSVVNCVRAGLPCKSDYPKNTVWYVVGKTVCWCGAFSY